MASEDGYDRFILHWAGWMLGLAERDAAGARRWMSRQQDYLDRTGIVETWITSFSTAMCDVVEGGDVVSRLRHTLDLADREGYQAEADCVLVLAYAAICADRPRRRPSWSAPPPTAGSTPRPLRALHRRPAAAGTPRRRRHGGGGGPRAGSGHRPRRSPTTGSPCRHVTSWTWMVTSSHRRSPRPTPAATFGLGWFTTDRSGPVAPVVDDEGAGQLVVEALAAPVDGDPHEPEEQDRRHPVAEGADHRPPGPGRGARE